MYKAAVRALMKHGIGRLSSGDLSFLLRLAAPDAKIIFPGDNSWSSLHRPVEKGRDPHATHRGLDECQSFTDRLWQKASSS